MHIETYKEYLQLKKNLQDISFKLQNYIGEYKGRNSLNHAYSINHRQFNELKEQLKKDKYLVKAALRKEIKFHNTSYSENLITSLSQRLNIATGKVVENTIYDILGIQHQPKFTPRFKIRLKIFLHKLVELI